jgi:hypothetical protein
LLPFFLHFFFFFFFTASFSLMRVAFTSLFDPFDCTILGRHMNRGVLRFRTRLHLLLVNGMETGFSAVGGAY